MLIRLLISSKAKKLNALLYAPIHGVFPEDLDHLETQIEKACKKLGYSKEYTRNWLTHNYRLLFSFQHVKNLSTKYPVKTLLDLGEESLFPRF